MSTARLQKATFLQATAGVVHQPSRKFRILNERVVRAVATFVQIGNTCLVLLTLNCASFTLLTFFPVPKFLIYLYRFFKLYVILYTFCNKTHLTVMRLTVMRLTVFAIIHVHVGYVIPFKWFAYK